MRGSRTVTRERFSAATLPLDQRAVLPDEQVEVLALLVRKLEKDLLALRILEALAVLLEEPVRVALAADADEQRLLIVDTAQQTIGAFGEQTVRRTLEEEERRPRFKLRVARHQLAVAPFELAEVLFLFRRQIVKHLAAARIACDLCGARVELEPAALGGNRDTQRIAGEQEVRVAGLGAAVTSRAALFARAVNLDDALRRTEAARGRDFLDERLDVRAEKFERPAAGLAN